MTRRRTFDRPLFLFAGLPSLAAACLFTLDPPALAPTDAGSETDEAAHACPSPRLADAGHCDADLANDNYHCGACAHACQIGERTTSCVSGTCTPHVFAKRDFANARDVGTRQGYVYVTHASDAGSGLYVLVGDAGTVRTTIAKSPDRIFVPDVASLVVTDRDGGIVLNPGVAPFAPGGFQVVGGQPFALNTSGYASVVLLSNAQSGSATAYWTTSDGFLRGVDLTYGQPAVREYARSEHMGPVVADGTHVYWASRTGSTWAIAGRSHAASDAPAFTLASDVPPPSYLAQAGDFVYLGATSGEVFRVAKDGCGGAIPIGEAEGRIEQLLVREPFAYALHSLRGETAHAKVITRFDVAGGPALEILRRPSGSLKGLIFALEGVVTIDSAADEGIVVAP